MGQHWRQFANFRRAHQTRCGDVISNMARCDTETLLDGDAVLPSGVSSAHTIQCDAWYCLRQSQKLHLMVFLGENDRLIMTIWCIGILRVTCIRLRREESCECR